MDQALIPISTIQKFPALVQYCKYFCQELSLNCSGKHLKAIEKSDIFQFRFAFGASKSQDDYQAMTTMMMMRQETTLPLLHTIRTINTPTMRPTNLYGVSFQLSGIRIVAIRMRSKTRSPAVSIVLLPFEPSSYGR